MDNTPGFENGKEVSPSRRIDFLSQFLELVIHYAFSFLPFKSKKEESNHVDLISQLPEPIIHYIFSFLPLKTIIVTSILSKTWYDIFVSFNILVFDFIYKAYMRSNPLHNAESTMPQTYLDLIDDIVCRRLQSVQDSGNRLQTLNIAIYFPDSNLLIPRLNFWLRNAVENNVSEVYLKVLDRDEYRPNIWYEVPASLLVATQLTSLELGLCAMECASFTKLGNLRRLVLTEVIIDDDYMFLNLSICCPLIEHLNLNSCHGITKLSSGSCLPQLRHLELCMCYVLSAIHVEAPLLESLIFYGTNEHLDLTCEIKLLGASSSLKVLKLLRIEITALSFTTLLSEHPCIEHLMLRKCISLCHFRICSQSLKILTLRECPRLATVIVKTPCLESVDHDKPSTLFTLINFTTLCKLHIQLEFVSMDEHWSNLGNVLKKTCFFKDLKLALKSRNDSDFRLKWYDPKEYFCDPQDVVIHSQMSAVSFSAHLKELLKISNPFVLISSMSYTYLLDDLFDMCYPRTLSLVCSIKCAKSVLDDIMHYHRNWSRRSRKSHFRAERIWEGRYRDFEVGTINEAEEMICGPLKSFLDGHSIRGYMATTLELKWFKARPNF